MIAKDIGSNFGLKVTLNLEQYEYMPGLVRMTTRYVISLGRVLTRKQGRHATNDASIMCGNGIVWDVVSVVVTEAD